MDARDLIKTEPTKHELVQSEAGDSSHTGLIREVREFVAQLPSPQRFWLSLAVLVTVLPPFLAFAGHILDAIGEMFSFGGKLIELIKQWTA